MCFTMLVSLVFLLTTGIIAEKGAVIMYASYKPGKDDDLVRISFPNKKEYCKIHGYYFSVNQGYQLPSEEPPAFAKIDLLLRSLERFDWVLAIVNFQLDVLICSKVMWMDADTIITNMSIPVAPLCTHDFVIAKDHFGINTGIMCWRNSEWSRHFLQKVWDAREKFRNHGWVEQGAIMKFMDDEPADSQKEHIRIATQKEINAYPPHTCKVAKCYAWQYGDWVIHFPGGKPHDWKGYLHPYVSQIIRPSLQA
eukprot:m.178507 g.178507  ORF g.178507 m.178507 type:complete len:252 (-) comp15468_c0_seq6:233-988(-)